MCITFAIMSRRFVSLDTDVSQVYLFLLSDIAGGVLHRHAAAFLP